MTRLEEWKNDFKTYIDELYMQRDDYRGIMEYIDEVPNDTEWIPVSERLPKKNVEVLVTTEWDCITIGEMFSNNDWFIHEGATNANIDDIKAWMPLPEPYKAESEEE